MIECTNLLLYLLLYIVDNKVFYEFEVREM
jgi:hypothetical protein